MYRIEGTQRGRPQPGPRVLQQERESGMPEIELWVLGTDDVAAPVSSFTSSTCAGPLFPPHRYPAGLSEMLNLATSCQHR